MTRQYPNYEELLGACAKYVELDCILYIIVYNSMVISSGGG